MRRYGQTSGQLFPKRWPLGNPNRTKILMNNHKVKYHQNSDTKTGNREHTRTTALERSVMNYWGLKHVLRVQPRNHILTFELRPNIPTIWKIYDAFKQFVFCQTMSHLQNVGIFLRFTFFFVCGTVSSITSGLETRSLGLNALSTT